MTARRSVAGKCKTATSRCRAHCRPRSRRCQARTSRSMAPAAPMPACTRSGRWPTSPEKTLDALDVARDGDDITVTTSARSFLHHQVRSMVGSLVWVGEGRWSADDLKAALEARDRAACGIVAPPDGLYLLKVEY